MKSQQALEETSTQTTLTKEYAVELNERSLTRLIYESSLYDHKPTSRALLIAIAMMSMSGDEFDTYPVSTRINHVANDDEECSRPVEIMQDQKPLFGD
jgi:hypothetical protein